MSRRAGLLGAALALAAVWPASSASAQEPQEPPPPDPEITRDDDPAWGGSYYDAPLDAGSHLSSESTVNVEGAFRYARDTDVRVTVVVEPLGPLASGCAHEGVDSQPTQRQPTDGLRGDYDFADVVDLPCNGRYRVRAWADVHWRPEDDPAATSPELTADLTVAAPAPDVAGLSVTEVEDGVDLTWTAPETTSPDFLGYEIERSVPDAAPEVLTTLGPDVLSYRDTTAPDERTGTSYRVIALRSGPDGTTMRSTEPAEATVPPPPDEETPDDTVPSAGGSDDDPVVPDDDEEPGRASPTPVRDDTPDTNDPSRPSLAPAPPGPVATPVNPGSPVTTTTVPYDDGFEERLPYRDRPEVAAGPVPAAPAKGVNRIGYDDGESGPGAALLTPIATALVLALWAADFRYLAKLGKVAEAPLPTTG